MKKIFFGIAVLCFSISLSSQVQKRVALTSEKLMIQINKLNI